MIRFPIAGSLPLPGGPCVQVTDAQSSSLGPWQGSVGLRKLSLEAVI